MGNEVNYRKTSIRSPGAYKFQRLSEVGTFLKFLRQKKNAYFGLILPINWLFLLIGYFLT